MQVCAQPVRRDISRRRNKGKVVQFIEGFSGIRTKRQPGMSVINVLHIDDEREDLEFIKLKLEKLDDSICVHSLDEPEKAIALIDQRKFDCILCDYQMPVVDGLDLLKQLRAGGNTTPFIMFTAQGNEQLAIDAFTEGADDYFSRQLEFASFNRLINSIKRAVERHRSREERLIMECALATVAETTSAQSGSELFSSMTSALIEALGIDVAMIGRLVDGGNIETLSFYNGRQRMKNISYGLAGTPCGLVINELMCVVEENAREKYPDDTFLNEQKIECYIGAALTSAEKKPIGLLTVMNRKPVRRPDLVLNVLRVFAARASVEMERNRMLERLKASEANYRAVFHLGMEPTAVVDPETVQVIDANEGYLKLFEYARDEVVGKTPRFFSAHPERYEEGKIEQLVKLIRDHKNVKVRWLAKSASGRVFWAIATFRALELDGQMRLMVKPRDASDEYPYDAPLKEDESHFLVMVNP